jgi:hypothetical protein
MCGQVRGLYREIIISEGLKEINQIHNQEINHKIIQKTFSHWIVKYTSSIKARKDLLSIFNESIQEYYLSFNHQSALIIQNAFRSKQRKFHLKDIYPLFITWKSKHLSRFLIYNNETELLYQYNYPTYDFSIDNIAPPLSLSPLDSLSDIYNIKYQMRTTLSNSQVQDIIQLDSVISDIKLSNFTLLYIKPIPRFFTPDLTEFVTKYLDSILNEVTTNLSFSTNYKSLYHLKSPSSVRDQQALTNFDITKTPFFEEIDSVISSFITVDFSPINNFSRTHKRSILDKDTMMQISSSVCKFNDDLPIEQSAFKSLYNFKFI